MMKYRKKPVEVEAYQYKHLLSDDELWRLDATPEWILEAVRNKTLYYDDAHENLFAKTLEGDMRVSDGDYIIKGVNGEIYPCKPDIFEKTYEKVEK